MSVWQRIKAWIVTDDPSPEYSVLDREGGLL
jgi:hypothetical protein